MPKRCPNLYTSMPCKSTLLSTRSLVDPSSYWDRYCRCEVYALFYYVVVVLYACSIDIALVACSGDTCGMICCMQLSLVENLCCVRRQSHQILFTALLVSEQLLICGSRTLYVDSHYRKYERLTFSWRRVKVETPMPLFRDYSLLFHVIFFDLSPAATWGPLKPRGG